MDQTSIDSLRVIIPVGGEAKRLQPLTAEVSKAVVRLLNRPIIEIAMARLAKQGIRHFIFGVKGYINYRSLHDYFKEGIGFSARYEISPRVHIKYQPHVEDVGSADSFRIVSEYYNLDSDCAVIQGDNIFDLDIMDMLRFHLSSKALMTIGLVPVVNVEGYGVAEVGQNARISKFIEKPKPDEAPSNLANAGIYLISPLLRKILYHEKVQAMIKINKRLDFGKDLIPYLIEGDYPVYGYSLTGDWFDLGTPENYLNSMLQLLHKEKVDLQGRVFGEHRIWIEGQSPESLVRREEIIQKARTGRIQLHGSVLIGRHCSIDSETTIVDSCIDNFCVVGKSVVLEKAALMDRTIVKDFVQVKDSIVGRHVIVNSSREKPTTIAGVSVIGDDVRVGEGCKIVSGRVRPHSVVPDNTMIVNRFFP